MKAPRITAAIRHFAIQPTVAPLAEHCTDAEYDAFLATLPVEPHHRQTRRLWRARFIARWPRLSDWLLESLVHRLGRRPGEKYKAASYRTSYYAHSYLYYLALTDRLRLDYPFLLGVGGLCAWEVGARLGVDWKIEALQRIGAGLGFKTERMAITLGWTVPRIAIHTGIRDTTLWTDAHLDELDEAIELYRRRPVSSKRTAVRPSKLIWPGHVFTLRVLLHHRGNNVSLPPRCRPRQRRPPSSKPAIVAPVERWLAIRAASWSPKTLEHQRVSLEHFLKHLASTEPDLSSFSQLTAAHAASFVKALSNDQRPSTGKTLSIVARRARLCAVAAFLRDAAAWGWPDVPTDPLFDVGALPRLPQRVPRFIPTAELDRLMDAIRVLRCRFQRTALLTARWSGARRGEIARLTLDCLDAYPDGTARVRIPAGKTYRERLVPVHDEAADALRTLIAYRQQMRDRPIQDERTGGSVRFLFLRRGRRISNSYLFTDGLGKACRASGLVDSHGKPLITAHRFRHTVGTQLAERGAKLHTIMSVLGHESPHMSMVYARISDEEVLRDYRSVLIPGAPLAGAGAEIVRAGNLSPSDIDWLQANFFKTALELGHCLRLPSEGPCECDLYLSCAKFVTTPKYAPRLRERHRLELKLAQDARERGWPREIERHCAIATRVAGLLKDLGQSLE